MLQLVLSAGAVWASVGCFAGWRGWSECDELGVEPAVNAEIVALLDNLQQLLIGICIMQVGLEYLHCVK